MKNRTVFILMFMALLPVNVSYARTDTLCKPLRTFAASVKPDETKSIVFHTSWGSDFKNSSEPALYAKRCLHNDYAPGKVVCDYLMEHGSVEFSNRNAMRAISCLFPKTKFDSLLVLNKIDASFSYGTGNKGSIINVSFSEASDIGGMALKISAEGY
jgi:hypothetical protein